MVAVSRVVVTAKPDVDIFHVGNLVVLKKSEASNGKVYVVLITDTSNDHFSGVIVHDEGCGSWHFAESDDRFVKDCFDQFRGTISLEA